MAYEDLSEALEECLGIKISFTGLASVCNENNWFNPYQNLSDWGGFLYNLILDAPARIVANLAVFIVSIFVLYFYTPVKLTIYHYYECEENVVESFAYAILLFFIIPFTMLPNCLYDLCTGLIDSVKLPFQALSRAAATILEWSVCCKFRIEAPDKSSLAKTYTYEQILGADECAALKNNHRSLSAIKPQISKTKEISTQQPDNTMPLTPHDQPGPK
jgi:hypothetical protein